MCGIAGFIDFNKKSSEEVLKRMADVQAHRGPDDSGYAVVEEENAQIGLGQRRLSILDLSPLGHQPMYFKNLSIVFNGEVYNFKEIRTKLEAAGYTFTSESDTEVIIKGFHYWGTKAVHEFIGMFAFVIYDNEARKAYIFRDRAGVKPLYYYWKNNCLMYSSELKSFHQHPQFEKELDTDSVALYLQYSYIPAPHCVFKNTYKLKPGHFLEINLKTRELKEQKYWDVVDAYNAPKLNISEEDAILETEKILKSAYEYRMVADVPVGVFLSGGYDSSSVAALLQTGRTSKIKTFTIGFHESNFNEAPEARKIADYLGTDHTEYYCTAKEAEDIIPEISSIYDEPFADNSIVPTILVSKLARKQVKVALSADGGDEIFAGYNKFNQAVKFTSYPIWLQIVLSKSMSLFNPEHIPYFNKKYNFPSRYEKMKLIWNSQSAVAAMKYISQYLTEKDVRNCLAVKFDDRATAFEIEKQIDDSNDWINKMLAVDYKTFLVDNNLVKVDRATMSVGLEGREPMLDHRIVEFTSRLPSHYKIQNGVNKSILKSVVHKYIPKEMMDRPKMPFIAPLTIWFRKELQELFMHYFDKQRLEREGLFNAEEVVRLRDSYLSGNKESHQKLWNMLIFQMWREKWMD
ncbi:MAG TPA: asparagine synthase (glutamine-hydrolyzing) [Cytophagales bacterium]|nr:asparagine synthase (glutamine-hydrolyzing) [Cytophagales bacterium]